MYRNIIVPLDGSPTAELGLREAIGLVEGQSATLHLLHIVDIAPMMMDMAVTVGSEELIDGLRRAGNEVLAAAKSRLQELGIPAQTSLREVTHGHVADAIVEAARSAGCDLIVMGTHGRRGLRRMALGSAAQGVVQASPVPVLLVRGGPPAH